MKKSTLFALLLGISLSYAALAEDVSTAATEGSTVPPASDVSASDSLAASAPSDSALTTTPGQSSVSATESMYSRNGDGTTVSHRRWYNPFTWFRGSAHTTSDASVNHV